MSDRFMKITVRNFSNGYQLILMIYDTDVFNQCRNDLCDYRDHV